MTTHLIRFCPLEFDASRVHVRWSVEPGTALYKQTEFTLDFGSSLDPRRLPLKLWWRLVMMCLHSHWNLLRPCRVVLPVMFPDGEVEFWLRLLDAERVCLEKGRGTGEFERTIEIMCSGPSLDDVELTPAVDRYAAAFSGGKDSLLQAALLCELTRRPLLVNTFSPMPPLKSDTSRPRAEVMLEITKRLPCELVEVRSDIRANWLNRFTLDLGYTDTVNEITDTFVYCAAMLPVAAIRGIRNILLAAEFDMNELEVYRDRIAQYRFFMYTPITLRSLSALFQDCGITLNSLLTPLTTFEVQTLLRRRYPAVRDLQISCWATRSEEERYCNRCHKCLRIAMILLALGHDPASIGLDVETLFGLLDLRQPDAALTGGGRSVAYSSSIVNLEEARRFFPSPRSRWRIGRTTDPFKKFESLVRRCRPYAVSWWGQYHPEYAKYLPPALQSRLDAIYRDYFPEIDSTDRDWELNQTDAEVNRITETLPQKALVPEQRA